MVLYLTSLEDVNLFDWIESEKGLPIKKLIGLYDLQKFFLRDMRNLSHCGYIIVNTKAINNSIEEITEAIQAVKTMYNARIIVFAEGEERGSELLSSLFDIDCYNIIISTKLADIKEDMERCLSPAGTPYELALSFKFAQDDNKETENTELYSFHKKGVYIGFLSPFDTNVSIYNTFSMASFLGKAGAKVAVVDINSDENFYQSLIPFYPSLHKVDGCYRSGNCDFYLPTDSFDKEDYHFIFINAGTEIIDLDSFDSVFILSEVFPWTIETLISWLSQIPKKQTLLLHNVSIKYQVQIRELLKNDTTGIFFLSQINELFDTIENKEVYEKCLEVYINAREK